jgi:phosphopantothenoylcysteine decarboxylase/phosphopantothenate--cysteine ligase
MLSLTNKRILLGITGGISAYKCAELVRLFIQAGSEVRVAMTNAAQEFITPLTLQALSGNHVFTSLVDVEAEAAMGHIELARWADIILIAPTTADFMAKITRGEANDIVSTLVLATQAPIAIAPAMNQVMWSSTATQKNLSELALRGIKIFGPAEGEQACGEIGLGRMLEPEELVKRSSELFEHGLLAGKNIVITGGPTREAIDPVRYISNHSSGKMAFALAAEAAAEGAKVTLISGPVSLDTPARVKRINVESAEQMLERVMSLATNIDIFIGVAAVADYRPAKFTDEKIKKGKENLDLKLIKNPDIISKVTELATKPFAVGFAAETNSLVESGRQKLEEKNLDLLFANNAVETFNNDNITVTAIDHSSERQLGPANKSVVARQMIELISYTLKEGLVE